MLFLSILAGSTAVITAMDKPIAFNYEQCEVADFDWDRDMADIYPIWQKEWDKLYIGRPYDVRIVDYLMAPGKKPEVEIKKTKVVRHQNRTIAFVNYYKRHEQNDIYIDTLAVAPEFQRKGIATHYLPDIILEALDMGVKEIIANSLKTNTPMHAVWKRLGFQIYNDTDYNGRAYSFKKILKKP